MRYGEHSGNMLRGGTFMDPPVNDPVVEIRYVASLATLGILRIANRTRFNGTDSDLSRNLDCIVIAMGIMVGEFEERPMTAHKLAAYLGIPRATIARKLRRLKRIGVVVERGANRHLQLVPLKDATPAAREAVALIAAACRRIEDIAKSLPEKILFIMGAFVL
jgi:biotin operon repressor